MRDFTSPSLPSPPREKGQKLTHLVHRLIASLPNATSESTNPFGAEPERGVAAANRSVPEEALSAASEAEHIISELRRRVAHLEHLALTDELTGLLNRRGFNAELTRTLATAQRYHEEGVLIYIDLDDFKSANDAFGHAAGDRILQHVSMALRRNIRTTDYAARLGGDEFAVLLVRTNWNDGLRRAEILEEEINKTMTEWQGRRIPIKASFGLEHFTGNSNREDLLHEADRAMYKVKTLRKSAKFNEYPMTALEEWNEGRFTIGL